MSELDDWLNDDSIPEDDEDRYEPDGLDLTSPSDINPRKFIKSMAAVYAQMGGDYAFLLWAKRNKGEFYKMFAKFAPKAAPVEYEDETDTKKDAVELTTENIEAELLKRKLPIPGGDDEF